MHSEKTFLPSRGTKSANLIWWRKCATVFQEEKICVSSLLSFAPPWLMLFTDLLHRKWKGMQCSEVGTAEAELCIHTSYKHLLYAIHSATELIWYTQNLMLIFQHFRRYKGNKSCWWVWKFTWEKNANTHYILNCNNRAVEKEKNREHIYPSALSSPDSRRQRNWGKKNSTKIQIETDRQARRQISFVGRLIKGQRDTDMNRWAER